MYRRTKLSIALARIGIQEELVHPYTWKSTTHRHQTRYGCLDLLCGREKERAEHGGCGRQAKAVLGHRRRGWTQNITAGRGLGVTRVRHLRAPPVRTRGRESFRRGRAAGAREDLAASHRTGWDDTKQTRSMQVSSSFRGVRNNADTLSLPRCM